MSNNKRVLCLYVPVIHQGYFSLFIKYAYSVDVLYVFGMDIINQFKYRGHEKRALDPEIAINIIRSLRLFTRVEMLTINDLESLERPDFILAKDGMSLRLAEKYLGTCKIEWDTTFLRYDETNVFSQEPLDNVAISTNRFDQDMIFLASQERQKSSDWWRQVGAVVVKDRDVMSTSHNKHLPSEYEPYFQGDPRDAIEAGKHSELCTAVHSEQGLVAWAARKVLKGCDVYVTTFPCPVCAKLLALSGIRRCFFKSGHASLDGRKILKAFDVEIVKVV